MTTYIRGLTLQRPWPWAVAYAGKPLENRTWKPRQPPGFYIAIHAGKGIDEVGSAWLLKHLKLDVLPEQSTATGIIAVAKYDGYVTESDSPYFFGPYGWLLEDVVVLPEPIPHRGAQSLWELEPFALEKVRELYKQAKINV